MAMLYFNIEDHLYATLRKWQLIGARIQIQNEYYKQSIYSLRCVLYTI